MMNANILIGICKGRSSRGRTVHRSEGYNQMWVVDSNGSVYRYIVCCWEHFAGRIKGKKIEPGHTMKAYGQNRGIAPLMLSLAINGGDWLTAYTNCCVAGKESQYPLNDSRWTCGLYKSPI